jgi:adenylate cyclase
MNSADAWELRGLKIFCVLSAMAAFLGLFYETLNPSPLLIGKVLQFGGTGVWLTGTLLIARYATTQRYVRNLIISIAVSFVGLYAISMADAVEFMADPTAEMVGGGRLFEHVLLLFPSTALLSLFLTRLWAVLLWVALCLVVPLQTIYAVIGLEEIYFTYDLTVLAVDGNAVNQDIMNMYRNATIFFILVLSGLVLFHGWALRSSVELEKSKENYRRYFSPEIGDEIESGDLVIGQDGSRVTDVAVLFTDIAGFTKLSEKMDPQNVLDLLSEYQTLMVDAIFQHKGTVDKFIGDAVMANFGTPRSHGNDAQNAFDCGVLMNHKLAEWNKTRAEKGLSEIQHRIGIHYGKCVVGNMGSEQRLEFAVIGDAVNVASRICDACKNFDTNFLISADVASRITHDVPSEDAPNVGIRGREGNIDLVKIYTERLGT